MKVLKTIALSSLIAGMLFASSDENYNYVDNTRYMNLSNSLIMDNHCLRVGVSDDGTFGYGGTRKPGIELSFKCDGNYSFKKENGSVVIPDYLTPGRPFEGFSIKFVNDKNQTIYKVNDNEYYTQMRDSNISAIAVSKDGNITAVLNNVVIPNYLKIKQLYTLNGTTLNIKVYLTNTTDKPLYNVRYARFLDPDPDVIAYNSYRTKNQLGLKLETSEGNITIPPTNIAYALGQQTNMPVGIFTFDNKYEHNVEFSSHWAKDPDIILKGGCNGDGDLNATKCRYGDYTIGLAFKIDKIAPHETAVLDLGYLFGTSLKKAVESSTRAKITTTYLDSLSKGWHLIGTSDAILNMSIFDNVSMVWVYEDGKWKYYTKDLTFKAAVEDAGIEKIKSIKPLTGIWVYKKDVTLPSFTVIKKDTNNTK